MKIHYKKTKLIIFNPFYSIDFMPEFNLEDNDLEVGDEMRLIGIIIKSDIKWTVGLD
jgi:hypothetical protein